MFKLTNMAYITIIFIAQMVTLTLSPQSRTAILTRVGCGPLPHLDSFRRKPWH